MPTCVNCHHKWGWKETLKKTMSLDPGMNCPYCDTKQYQTPKSKLRNGILNILILLPLLLNIFFDIPGVVLLSLFPILFILVMSIYPFFIELSNKDEYIDLFKV